MGKRLRIFRMVLLRGRSFMFTIHYSLSTVS